MDYSSAVLSAIPEASITTSRGMRRLELAPRAPASERHAAHFAAMILFALGALFSSVMSPAAAAAVTGSTRFIPTLLVYYGGGPVLTASDAARLAKYDLLDID